MESVQGVRGQRIAGEVLLGTHEGTGDFLCSTVGTHLQAGEIVQRCTFSRPRAALVLRTDQASLEKTSVFILQQSGCQVCDMVLGIC